MVVSAMGLPQDEQIGSLLNEYFNGDVVKITTILKDLLSSGVKAETLAEEIISSIIDDPKPELLPLLSKLPDIKSPFAEAKLLVALTERGAALPTAPKSVSAPPPSFNRSATNTAKNDLKLNDDDSEESKPDTLNSDGASFDWDTYVKKVKEIDDGVGRQLKNVKYELEGKLLHIFPTRNYVRNYLTRDKNKQVLVKATNGDVEITIHDEKSTSEPTKKDAVETKLSGIMGGEVQNDGGKNPFE